MLAQVLLQGAHGGGRLGLALPQLLLQEHLGRPRGIQFPAQLREARPVLRQVRLQGGDGFRRLRLGRQ